MKTLIIVLIIVMIIQTCVFIYANFIAAYDRREQVANVEILNSAQQNFVAEKERFLDIIKTKEKTILEWASRAHKLDIELGYVKKANGLLMNKTNYVEGLKDSFDEQLQREYKAFLCADILHDVVDKQDIERIVYAYGFMAAANWVAKCVGVDVNFEIDKRIANSLLS